MKVLASGVIAFLLLAFVSLAEHGSGFALAQDDLGTPGRVFEDRRDELRGGIRGKLHGLRPRHHVQPSSRMSPKSQRRVLLRMDPRVTPGPLRLKRLSVARRIGLDHALAACRARYRSFDEASGTYRTFAGETRRCPYLP